MSRKLELIIEEHNTLLYVDIEDNPRLRDTIPLSRDEGNQLTRGADGYYVPLASWEDMEGKPNSTTEEIDDAVSRSEQNESSIESLEQGKVDKVAGKGLSDENYTLAEKDKLTGIQAGATANATNSQLRDRTTHTGVQPISSVSGLQTELDSKADTADVNTQLSGKVDKVVGKQLSTEDFTTAEKSKLAELENFDSSLRDDLANPNNGAAMVGYGDGTVADKLDEITSGGGGGGGGIPVEWIDVEGAGIPLTDLSPDTMYILDVRSGNLIGIMIPENHSDIPVGAEYHFVCAGDPYNAHIYEDNIGEVME